MSPLTPDPPPPPPPDDEEMDNFVLPPPPPPPQQQRVPPPLPPLPQQQRPAQPPAPSVPPQQRVPPPLPPLPPRRVPPPLPPLPASVQQQQNIVPPPLPQRPPRLAVSAQRAPVGSTPQSTTSTVNTPKICYVHNLYIKEEWIAEDAPAPAPPGDTDTIENEIEQLRTAVDNKQKEFDLQVVGDNFDYDAKLSALNKFIRDKEIEILNLEIKRGQIIASETTVDYAAPSGLREFIIVKQITPDIEARRRQAQSDLTVTRNKLVQENAEWLRLHTEHEATKQKLAAFIRKKRQLNDERKKACQAYENARSKKRKKQAGLKPALEQAKFEFEYAERELQTALAEKNRALGNALLLPKAQEKLNAAQKKRDNVNVAHNNAKQKYDAAGAETNDEKETKRKFTEAKDKYNNSGTEYTTLNNKRKEDYKKLKLSAGKITKITEDLLKEEKAKQEAINTIASGNEIQMIGFAKNDSMKSADVLLEANKIGKYNFEEGFKKFFNASVHSNGYNASEGHPLISIDNNGKPLQSQAFTTKFTPNELHELLIAAKKQSDLPLVNKPENEFVKGIRSVFSGGANSVGNIKEFFRNLSNTPATRDYMILSKSCGKGAKPSALANQEFFDRLTEKLSVKIRTFPADTYTLSIAAKPASKIGAQQGDKKNLSTGAVEGDNDPVNEKWGVNQIVKPDKEVKWEPGANDQETEKNKTAAHADAAEDKLLDSLRVPNQKPVLQEVPIDISLKRNKYEDPITEDLRKTVGLFLFLAQKSSDLFSRIGNIVPTMGWKVGFEASFFTGKLSYTDEWKEHTDWRVWHHRRGDLDLNLVSVKGFLFAGFSIDVLLLLIEFGGELYIKGSVGVKGFVENTHPDATKHTRIGIGPTGSVGIGLEIRAVIGRPDWVKASGTVETALTVEAMWYLMSDEGTYVDYKFGWEGVSIVVLCHIALIGHWEKKWTPAKAREIKAGRYPEKVDTEKLLGDLAKQREEDMKEAIEEAKKLEKKRLKLQKERDAELARASRRNP